MARWRRGATDSWRSEVRAWWSWWRPTRRRWWWCPPVPCPRPRTTTTSASPAAPPGWPRRSASRRRRPCRRSPRWLRHRPGSPRRRRPWWWGCAPGHCAGCSMLNPELPMVVEAAAAAPVLPLPLSTMTETSEGALSDVLAAVVVVAAASAVVVVLPSRSDVSIVVLVDAPLELSSSLGQLASRTKPTTSATRRTIRPRTLVSRPPGRASGAVMGGADRWSASGPALSARPPDASTPSPGRGPPSG